MSDGVNSTTGRHYGHAIKAFGTKHLALSAHENEAYEVYDSLVWDPNVQYGSDLAWAPITPTAPKGGAELYLEFSVQNTSVFDSSAASHRRRRLQSTAPSTTASSSASLHGCGGAGGIGIMVQTLGMPAIARSRVVIGLIILIGVYAVIVTEILHRAVVGLIGALLVCGLLGLIGTPPTFNTVIDWMDEGTLGLLFGMMVIVAMLSTTGLFEWLAVKALKFSKGNILVLMVLLSVSVGECFKIIADISFFCESFSQFDLLPLP